METADDRFTFSQRVTLQCVLEDLNLQRRPSRENISTIFSSKSETKASELLEYFGEMVHSY